MFLKGSARIGTFASGALAAINLALFLLPSSRASMHTIGIPAPDEELEGDPP